MYYIIIKSLILLKQIKSAIFFLNNVLANLYVKELCNNHRFCFLYIINFLNQIRQFLKEINELLLELQSNISPSLYVFIEGIFMLKAP